MKDAYYFPHDSNAKDDPKLSLIIEDLGLVGYGAYWIIIESLRDQSDYKLPYSMIKVLARKYNCKIKIIESVVYNYNLFIQEENVFYSNSLINRMLRLETKREKLSEAGKKGAQAKAMKQPPVSDASATLKPPLSHPQAVEYSITEHSTTEEIKTEQNTTEIINTGAYDFLIQNVPTQLEQLWMKNSSLLAQKDEIIIYFNNKVDLEDIEYTDKKLLARLKLLFQNWNRSNAAATSKLKPVDQLTDSELTSMSYSKFAEYSKEDQERIQVLKSKAYDNLF